MVLPEETDPRSQRYPLMPEESVRSLLMGARRVVGRIVVLSEVRELSSLDGEASRSWRELKTAALSLGQAINAVSCVAPPILPTKFFDRLSLAWAILWGSVSSRGPGSSAPES